MINGVKILEYTLIVGCFFCHVVSKIMNKYDFLVTKNKNENMRKDWKKFSEI